MENIQNSDSDLWGLNPGRSVNSTDPSPGLLNCIMGKTPPDIRQSTFGAHVPYQRTFIFLNSVIDVKLNPEKHNSYYSNSIAIESCSLRPLLFWRSLQELNGWFGFSRTPRVPSLAQNIRRNRSCSTFQVFGGFLGLGGFVLAAGRVDLRWHHPDASRRLQMLPASLFCFHLSFFCPSHHAGGQSSGRSLIITSSWWVPHSSQSHPWMSDDLKNLTTSSGGSETSQPWRLIWRWDLFDGDLH